MTPAKLTDATRSLGKPADWNDDKGSCDTLDIFDYDSENGHFMLSAWQPELEELEVLNNNGFVYLHIRGTNHPVVAITVGE